MLPVASTVGSATWHCSNKWLYRLLPAQVIGGKSVLQSEPFVVGVIFLPTFLCLSLSPANWSSCRCCFVRWPFDAFCYNLGQVGTKLFFILTIRVTFAVCKLPLKKGEGEETKRQNIYYSTLPFSSVSTRAIIW